MSKVHNLWNPGRSKRKAHLASDPHLNRVTSQITKASKEILEILPNMRAAKAQLRTTSEFQRSNSTTNAFIGGTKKAWMTTGSSSSPESTRDPSTPKVSMPKALDQASTVSHRAESASEEANRAVENSNLPNTAFEPNIDRGGHPAQRRRQENTKNHARRSSASLAAGSTPLVLSPLAVEESSRSTNAENVLPSPSPSVEARQNSVNVIEVEDDGTQPLATEVLPVRAPTATLEELVTRCGGMDQFEKLLKDAGKSNYGPSQIAASAVVPELSGPSPSSSPRRQGRPASSKNQSRFESDHDVPAPSISNKRPQESPNEPRKRLQSLPGSSSDNAFVISSATTVLPCQNGQVCAPASPSGIPHYQILRERIQLVASLPDREGSNVELPRLGLLVDACETSDHFYLVLHQLFCIEHEARRSNGQVSGLNESHKKGLDVVAFLLVSNNKMVDDAVTWFSLFPSPLVDLIMNRSEFASAHAKVLRCLDKLRTHWADVRSQCSKRMYPPLVDELIVLFNVESFLFQQIIFRAILRDIWSGKPDECFHKMEEVFNKDYIDVFKRLSIGNIPVEAAQIHQKIIINEYQAALKFHRQHTITGPVTSMAPPRQQQTQTHLDPASNHANNRIRSQSEHNRNTQSPLAFDLHAAQRHSRSVASGPAPIAIQTIQNATQGSHLNQNPSPYVFLSPQGSNFTQSPTTLQGSSNSVAPINSPGQWNGQQYQRERRTSSTVGTPFSSLNNLHSYPQSTTPTQQTPHVVPSNMPGDPQMHLLQQNPGLRRQSHDRVPSSNIANPRPSVQPEVRRSLSIQASGTSLPTPNPRPFMQSPPSLPPHTDVTPFIRAYPPLPAHPNPTVSALHQAHLRSPVLSYFNLNENSSSMARCYRFIKHVFMPPEELGSKNRHVNWDFRASKEVTDWFARDAPSSHGAPPIRAIVPGSRLCRIRCIGLKDKGGMPTQSEWAVADNVWPGSTAVVLNGIALDIRKKTHHGKDLPIDVTSYIKAGQNNLSTAVIGFQKDSTSRYAIGVEFIQVVDGQKIKDEMRLLPENEARQRILDQSRNLDPDIEVVQSQRVIDLTDPFTARIFDVPVRGVNCHHNQCFDRDTFLQTRTAKVPGEPCGPDEFRCPICGQDARPQSLMMDMFFAGVRTSLRERGRLDVKTIILHDSGDWDIREEEEVLGESGDGTGRRSTGLAAASTASEPTAKQSVPREVIELDDD